MPNPDEVAVLNVRGQEFSDWETVWVQVRHAESYPHFRFTAAERDVPDIWTKLQFKPGDPCTIHLGGELVVTGVITTRQVAYDANNHSVQLSGKGIQWYANKSSVLHKTGNFDGKTFEQVGREVLKPFGFTPKIIGTLNAIPFVQLQLQPGETVWDFLERIARPRGIVLGTDENGNILFIDHHVGRVVEQLEEGKNILKCQCVITQEYQFVDYIVRGQTGASDDQHGRDASEQECKVTVPQPRYSCLITPCEQPVWKGGEVCDRAKNEAIWHVGTEINATVTVQGWLRRMSLEGEVIGNVKELWRAGDDVYIKSPMATLDQVLKIMTATFTQDRDSGTLTTLELVPPWLLKDNIAFNVGRPGATQAPGDGVSTGGTVEETNPPGVATVGSGDGAG